jgi:hypothetical protein
VKPEHNVSLMLMGEFVILVKKAEVSSKKTKSFLSEKMIFSDKKLLVFLLEIWKPSLVENGYLCANGQCIAPDFAKSLVTKPILQGYGS